MALFGGIHWEARIIYIQNLWSNVKCWVNLAKTLLTFPVKLYKEMSSISDISDNWWLCGDHLNCVS